jgi:diguanylate cyclase (GGDEF)-like protein
VQSPVSASVGVAVYPQAGSSMAELFERADRALYEAKRAGKRRVAVAR